MSWKQAASSLPGIGVSLLPKVACPACWPAYAGLLSAMGLGFVPLSTKYLLPLTATFLLIAVVALGVGARSRHGYRPMLLGILASAVVLFGKFSLESDRLMYAGLAVLVAASVWNTWPQSKLPCCVEPNSQQALAEVNKSRT